MTEQQGNAKRQVTCFNRGKEGHLAREWEQRRFLKLFRERTEQSQLLDCRNDSMKGLRGNSYLKGPLHERTERSQLYYEDELVQTQGKVNSPIPELEAEK